MENMLANSADGVRSSPEGSQDGSDSPVSVGDHCLVAMHLLCH